MSTGSVPIAAIVPGIVIVAAFLAYCFVDLRRSRVRYMPKWAWALVFLVSVPIGGIVYLLIGREE